MKSVVRLLGWSSAIFAVPLLLPAAASAQDIGDLTSIVIAPNLDRTDVAGARMEPDYAPQPLMMGPVIVDASLSLAAGYDTNVYDRADAAGDVAAIITPRLRVRANTARHLLQLSGIGNVRRFASNGSENSEEFRLIAQSRADLAERQSVFAEASFASEAETRSSAGTIAGADEPVTFQTTTARVGADFAFGRLVVRPAGTLAQTDYSDLSVNGSEQDISFRDMSVKGADLSVGYEFTELFQAFTQVGFQDAESDNPLPGAARDSQDLTVLAGVRGQLSPLIDAEFAVGYRDRDYALDRYRDFSGLTYRADIQWFITPLMTLRFDASQSVLNSGIANVAGILSNRFSVTGYFDPLRNLRLSTTIGYQHNAYRDTDTVAQLPSLRLQAEYRANRNMAIGGFVGLRRQEVSGAPLVPSFTSLSAGIGVTLTP